MNEIQNYRRIFGQYIKGVRENLNLSQEGAARKIDLSRQQWNRLENGLSGTTLDTALRIAKEFNLEEKEVLNKAGFDKPEPDANIEDIERVELEAMYRKRKKLSPARREAFSRILDMVDRELDRLIEEEKGNSNNGSNASS